jgi:hypothetical protein
MLVTVKDLDILVIKVIQKNVPFYYFNLPTVQGREIGD